MAITMSDVQKAMAGKGSLYRGLAHVLSNEPTKWAKEADLDWTVEKSSLFYKDDAGLLYEDETRSLLYRSDTLQPLAPVGKRFKPVQPEKIISFFGTLAARFKFKLELAGQSHGGRKIWALASTPFTFGEGQEKVDNYLCLSTANDGTASTKGFFTTFRLHCTNQLPMLAVTGEKTFSRDRIGNIGRISHSREFSTDRMAQSVQHLEQRWNAFETAVGELQNKRVKDSTARNFFLRLNQKDTEKLPVWDELHRNSLPYRLYEVYKHEPTTVPITGTAWGLVNAVTHYMDHGGKTGNGEARIDRVWLGSGKRVKERAFMLAHELTH